MKEYNTKANKKRIERERIEYVIHCMIKRFSDNEALAYLKGVGFEMSSVTYWRYRKRILANRFKRIAEIADHELIDQHMERIVELLLIKKEMWSRYHQERNNSRAFEMLVDLVNIQPAISQYYASTHKVIEKQQSTKPQPQTIELEQHATQDNYTV